MKRRMNWRGSKPTYAKHYISRSEAVSDAKYVKGTVYPASLVYKGHKKGYAVVTGGGGFRKRWEYQRDEKGKRIPYPEKDSYTGKQHYYTTGSRTCMLKREGYRPLKRKTVRRYNRLSGRYEYEA
jgi:hypothetical protein